MWGKGEEIGVLCVAFDALYNRFIYTEKLLKQPFHLMLVEVRLVIYLLLNRWEHFLNGVQRSIRGILFFSRMTICCAPLLLQQSEAPDSDTLCSTPARKQDECELMLKAAPLKNFDSLEDQQWNWEMSGQRDQMLWSPLSQRSHRELSRAMWVVKLWQSHCSPCPHFLSRKHCTPFRAWAPHMHLSTAWKGQKVSDFTNVALCYKFLVYVL